jgi:O-methyltransferase
MSQGYHMMGLSVKSAIKATLLASCQVVLRRLGYKVEPITWTVDSMAALTVKDAQLYKEWTSPCPLYAPWSGWHEFDALYEGVQAYTVVSPDRCYILGSIAQYASTLDGDFAECGVYKGGTALLLSRVLKRVDSEKTLHLFDSFEGLPKGTDEKDEWFRKGQFAVESVESVERLLKDVGVVIDIRKGWIPDTFVGLQDEQYAFVHVDVDLYQSALDCCRYFYPRLVTGGVMLFDEYGFPAAHGEKEAVDEYFATKSERPIALPTGQALVLKSARHEAMARLNGQNDVSVEAKRFTT